MKKLEQVLKITILPRVLSRIGMLKFNSFPYKVRKNEK